MMARALVVLAVLWPAVAAAAVMSEVRGATHPWTVAVHLVGSRLCHQRPERSFHSAGVAWPVCARCSGLYLGGAFGAAFGLVVAFRPWTRDAGVRRTLVIAALPTASVWLAEWMFSVSTTNGVRFIAAVPLGAVVAAAIVAVACRTPKPNQVN